jgi:hypothetical protein
MIEAVLSDRKTEWLALFNPLRGLRNAKEAK